MTERNEEYQAEPSPNSEMDRNHQAGASSAVGQARLKKPTLGSVAPIQNTPKKRKDDLEVTIAPGLESTDDIALGPPR